MTTTLRLRTRQLDKYMRLSGINTKAELARRMGMATSSVTRVLAGQYRPGETFISRLMSAFPDLEFEDLFEVVDHELAPTA
ncbi:MAG: helix-turn-helix transcriptional regulator [Actinobacteria bacterium]|nr:helix-turn-helix transcriptional regulator [Actinomycetota bacterium]MDZ4235721.1 helix-turn-helix transcriptional regulator [Dietzia sp.]